MGDAVQATVAAEPVAAADVPRTADGAVDANAFGKLAQAAVREQAEKHDAAHAEPQTGAGQVAADKSAPAKPRDDKGKFAPTDKAGATQDDKPSEPKADEKADEAQSHGLGRMRKLFHDGDLAKVFELLAPGKSFEEATSAINSKAFIRLREQSREVNAHKREVEALLSQGEARYGKYHQAERLMAKGDLQAAIEAMTGKSLADVQTEILRTKHAKPAPSPEVAELREQLEALRRERDEERAKVQQQTEAQAEAQAMRQLTDMLAGSDVPQIARAAAKPRFVARVREILEEHWDDQAKVSIPPREAALLAYEEFYDGVIDAPTAAAPARKQGPTPTTVARTARRAGAMPTARAAEAAAEQLPYPPGDPRLATYFAEKLQRHLDRERNGGAR